MSEYIVNLNPFTLSSFDKKNNLLVSENSSSMPLNNNINLNSFALYSFDKKNNLLKSENSSSIPLDNNINLKNSLVLLSFEDDTFRIAIKLEDKYMDIINNWYKKSNNIVEIDNLNIDVPVNIYKSDLNEILYNSFNISSKNTILEDFIPQYISKLKIDKYLKNIDLFTQPVIHEKKINNNILITPEKLGIVIPNNVKLIPNNVKLIINSNLIIDDELYSIVDIEKHKSDIMNVNGIDQSSFIPSRNTEYDKYEGVNIIDKPIMKCIFIVLNYIHLNTFILENPTIKEKEVITNNTEYGFIELFNINTENKHIINFIEESFNNYLFNNIDELNKTLDILSRYIELFTKSTMVNQLNDNEEKQIHNFLKSQYIFDNDINNRIKFTDLYNILSTSLHSSIGKTNGFKNRLSSYLKKLGLEKKRYNDGYYYYGIKKKNIEEYLTEINRHDKEEKNNFNFKTEYEKLIAERKNLI